MVLVWASSIVWKELCFFYTRRGSKEFWEVEMEGPEAYTTPTILRMQGHTFRINPK